MNPYLVLGLTADAEDQRIRQAYLDAIKQATPENNPERFKLLTGAYEQIRDEPSRHNYELHNTDTAGNSPLEACLMHVQAGCRPAPLSFEKMKEYLQVCSKT